MRQSLNLLLVHWCCWIAIVIRASPASLSHRKILSLSSVRRHLHFRCQQLKAYKRLRCLLGAVWVGGSIGRHCCKRFSLLFDWSFLLFYTRLLHILLVDALAQVLCQLVLLGFLVSTSTPLPFVD